MWKKIGINIISSINLNLKYFLIMYSLFYIFFLAYMKNIISPQLSLSAKVRKNSTPAYVILKRLLSSKKVYKFISSLRSIEYFAHLNIGFHNETRIFNTLRSRRILHRITIRRNYWHGNPLGYMTGYMKRFSASNVNPSVSLFPVIKCWFECQWTLSVFSNELL